MKICKKIKRNMRKFLSNKESFNTANCIRNYFVSFYNVLKISRNDNKHEAKKYLIDLTFVWLGVWSLIFVISFVVKGSMSLNEIGDFFAGVFSPLAFAWLIFGYFLQSKELKEQRQEFQKMAANTEYSNLLQRSQLQPIISFEMHPCDEFSKYNTNKLKDLSDITHMRFIFKCESKFKIYNPILQVYEMNYHDTKFSDKNVTLVHLSQFRNESSHSVTESFYVTSMDHHLFEKMNRTKNSLYRISYGDISTYSVNVDYITPNGFFFGAHPVEFAEIEYTQSKHLQGSHNTFSFR